MPALVSKKQQAKLRRELKSIEFALSNGFVLERTGGGHIRAVRDGVESIVMSATPSDAKSDINALSRLKRHLKNAGIPYGDHAKPGGGRKLIDAPPLDHDLDFDSASEHRPFTKICSRCGLHKVADQDFHTSPKGGRNKICKECTSKAMKAAHAARKAAKEAEAAGVVEEEIRQPLAADPPVNQEDSGDDGSIADLVRSPDVWSLLERFQVLSHRVDGAAMMDERLKPIATELAKLIGEAKETL